MDTVLMVIGLAVILSTASCQPRPASGDVTNRIDDNEVKYHYQFGVEDADSGVIQHKWEERLGDYVKGAYSLMEPDGKIRTVDYEVDGEKGFHAIIRTSLPGNSYLSLRQLHTSRLHHRNPPVNILTNNPLPEPPVLESRTPRLIKDLPPNFHSDKPDYFWGSLPHDHFTNRHPPPSNPDHTSNHLTNRHPPSGNSDDHFTNRQQPLTSNLATPHALPVENSADYEFTRPPPVRREERRLRQPIAIAEPINPLNPGAQFKRLNREMMPPRINAPVMNYDHLLRPGTVTFASYG